MDVLMVTPELASVAKASGVGDVVLGLSKALRALGHKVTVVMPRYPGAGADLMLARRLTPLELGEAGAVTIFDARLPSGVDLVLLDLPGTSGEAVTSDFSPTTSVYGGPAGETTADEAAGARFGLFARAVAELASRGTWDVLHLHDWPAAVVAYLLRGREKRPRTVLTIHNVQHQGMFSPAVLAPLGLDRSHFTPEALEFYGKVSFLKGGILAADALATVSPRYAEEMLTPDLGERLEGVLRARGAPIGILNGVDYAVMNPATDAALPVRFDAEDPANKGRCKSALLEHVGLPIRPEIPLFAFVGRLVPQKGADLLAEALPKLLRNDLAVVCVGEGDPAIERSLRDAASRRPEQARVLGRVSEADARRVFAAADFVLVPSRREPCGLVQLYAQRYGAVPIATRTGGLTDTIVDADAGLTTGTGLLFDGPSREALEGAVQRALAAWASPAFPSLRRRVMRLDLGWERAARRYERLYRAG